MNVTKAPWLGASLFSGAGLGDLGFRAAGVEFLALAEIDAKRAALARSNFPESEVFVADLNLDWGVVCGDIAEELRRRDRELDILACTPPCQGMSKSGQGTLLKNIRAGKRPKLDPRNRLILPALDAIRALKPRWIVLENVVEMQRTLIEDSDGEIRPILEIIATAVEPLGYIGQAYPVEFANYGIAQRRQRLITVLTRDRLATNVCPDGRGLVPAPTHSSDSLGLEPWVSVSEALSGFPPLDGRSKELATHPSIPYHRVPVLDARKYEWIANTPRGASAFDNQCINVDCGYEGNPTHGNARINGVNRAKKTTPTRCARCGRPLPRPTTIETDGSTRIMSGYTSAYKRMRADLPAPALTRNLSYPCSDHKIHPTENRVLSLAEAFVLQTVADYEFHWTMRSELGVERRASDSLIRLVLGESVPPRFLDGLARHIQRLSAGECPAGAEGVKLRDPSATQSSLQWAA
jgi:DNA (cytosine-5)-methyltransferase 1